MQERSTHTMQPAVVPCPDHEDARPARIARDLLAQSEPCITRIAYVGLPGRQAVHVAAAARGHGLVPHLMRDGGGHVTIALIAPPTESAASLLASKRPPGALAGAGIRARLDAW